MYDLYDSIHAVLVHTFKKSLHLYACPFPFKVVFGNTNEAHSCVAYAQPTKSTKRRKWSKAAVIFAVVVSSLIALPARLIALYWAQILEAWR